MFDSQENFLEQLKTISFLPKAKQKKHQNRKEKPQNLNEMIWKRNAINHINIFLNHQFDLPSLAPQLSPLRERDYVGK